MTPPMGAIKSDAGVEGLPCDGVHKQGEPCTSGVTFIVAWFVCITFNRARRLLKYSYSVFKTVRKPY